MNQEKTQKALFNAIYRMCKPIVRILLRNGVPFSGLADILRKVYVEVAMNEFGMDGRKQSDSRVATLTGLTRKEVKRLRELEDGLEQTGQAQYNRAARVVFGWVHDPRYQNLDDTPLVLKIEGEQPSFSALVKDYSGDMPHRAILDELKHSGVIEVIDKNQVKLLKPAYIPGESEIEKLGYLGNDVAGLLNTMDRNIYQKQASPFFQRKIYYDNLPEEVLDEIKDMLDKKGQRFLQDIDLFMAKRDRDVNPKIEGTGRKAAGIGLYYFEENGNEVEDKIS